MKSNPRMPVALIAVGATLMIIGSIVGFVSGSQLLLVCMTAAVGITCLVVAIYLYRQLSASSNIGDDH
ncbi:Uncharacterised protein [Mycobacteroides abscessus subsp. abscessus]|uniref:hypothetical protein n=2 Tax=Mycobacteroides abscessus TaxID=36809 RepID=UPI00092B6518|nr:hypothetical protein [Mycobacteroides abscessus]SHS37090.1 Uncharacterised protein [Mycobacteroides abscessus subsp. abscessus]SHS52593.1 Uncharacterised protein [Mycobacteroides abscessus subsp. abscessus]SHS84958.1 Uncharacterised protein [Mycobacteroides abscessus subsp. abscessus]SHT05580.1 Uncharacterised protein [Mycobacteroides abscessus subsp. abscessus]SHT83659.1 Uncharacterised protein [Mycobacteroides abscessus subsp. abscessus]